MSQDSWIFQNEELSISVQQSRESALIVWRGVSDTRHPSAFLNPLTEKLVPQLKGVKVTVDFRRLEYMNSATVATLINLIKNLDANGSPVLVLFSDDDWQRVHLTCMRSIARTLKNVRVESNPDSQKNAERAATGNTK